VINNSEVWANIPQGAYNQLEDLQKMFYRYLFATPISTPTLALLWETGGLTMKYRIITKKLSFYQHLMSLEENCVASRVARIADRSGYPGLMQEYQTLCTELNLPNPTKVSKHIWKNKVRNAVLKANRSYLLDQIQTKYEKLDYDTLKEEDYKMKDYV
jgi:hypothetical protein